MSTFPPSGPAPHRRRFTRSGSVITALATVVALWLGLSAPGISPVAPTPTAEATIGTRNQSTTDATVNVVHHRHAHR
jgi:hypothetical protein